MFKTIVLSCAAALLFSCNDNSKTEDPKTDSSTSTETTTPPTTATDANSSGCYAYTANGDSILLVLQQQGESVKGSLIYALKEKDRNSGTIDGTIKDGKILARYTFASEGSTSIRQVAFIKKGESFVEGYGPIEQSGNEARFRNTDSLTYNDAFPLRKTECK